ncbi:MAG: type IV pilus twitching motility protein PilT [Candidatus Eisenbacteria bacterium]|uniref:Type IV pilus twitching motility protein PilT n=1 Tax=Eiseniibacteriota bacterium TaxID=2212470 RepID=A0A9D6QKC1_UNCEI|nr:type IV pilus twitching motility protein PilT [Candidatus Eisenbacteria bacterium]MBI3540051.1 type IV pilus twitching motility protein PilT [Candidatus Eisenbacteria bacterium]
MVTLRQLLEEMTQKGASDLHITAGVPPEFRIDGLITPTEHDVLTPDLTAQLAYSVMSDEQRKRFETTRELDFSFGVKGLSRFRANVFLQRGVISMAVRQIPYDILPMEKLGLPPVVREFTNHHKGFVLVTGPTGSGKSTTLASMLDKINATRQAHIMTIEDPIEYIHHHKKSIVNQREIGADTNSFPTALKYVLRQDPDIILIGEMRDLETIEAALTIAETGHLVFATLHTNSTYEAVNRIVDVFPADQQRQTYTQLAFTLQGVVTQQLVPRSYGPGRVMVSEVLVCTPAIRAVIREGKTHQIYSLMQAGQKFGMQTMNQGLLQAVLDKALSPEGALERSTDRPELEGMLEKVLRAAA